MDNSNSLMKNDGNDRLKINSNVNEVESTSNYILLKKRSAFANMMSRIFPREVDRVKNQYFVDTIKEKANKNIALYQVQTQYEVQVLTEVMNLRLVGLKTEAREAVSKRMSVKLIEISNFINEKKAIWEETIDGEEKRINNLKTEMLRRKALESLGKTIDTVYHGLDTLLEKFENLLNEEIKINSQ